MQFLALTLQLHVDVLLSMSLHVANEWKPATTWSHHRCKEGTSPCFLQRKKKSPTCAPLLFPRKSQTFLVCIPLCPHRPPLSYSPPPPSFSTSSSSSSTHNHRPALAFPMCLRACIEGDGRLGGFGLFLNLQGPGLLAGTPSLVRIVASVLRSDLESVLTGNQQFLRWSNGLHYDGGQ